VSRTPGHDQVEVALAVPLLDVARPCHFSQRPEGLREDGEPFASTVQLPSSCAWRALPATTRHVEELVDSKACSPTLSLFTQTCSSRPRPGPGGRRPSEGPVRSTRRDDQWPGSSGSLEGRVARTGPRRRASGAVAHGRSLGIHAERTQRLGFRMRCRRSRARRSQVLGHRRLLVSHLSGSTGESDAQASRAASRVNARTRGTGAQSRGAGASRGIRTFGPRREVCMEVKRHFRARPGSPRSATARPARRQPRLRLRTAPSRAAAGSSRPDRTRRRALPRDLADALRDSLRTPSRSSARASSHDGTRWEEFGRHAEVFGAHPPATA